MGAFDSKKGAAVKPPHSCLSGESLATRPEATPPMPLSTEAATLFHASFPQNFFLIDTPHSRGRPGMPEIVPEPALVRSNFDRK